MIDAKCLFHLIIKATILKNKIIEALNKYKRKINKAEKIETKVLDIYFIFLTIFDCICSEHHYSVIKLLFFCLSMTLCQFPAKLYIHQKVMILIQWILQYFELFWNHWLNKIDWNNDSLKVKSLENMLIMEDFFFHPSSMIICNIWQTKLSLWFFAYK